MMYPELQRTYALVRIAKSILVEMESLKRSGNDLDYIRNLFINTLDFTHTSIVNLECSDAIPADLEHFRSELAKLLKSKESL